MLVLRSGVVLTECKISVRAIRLCFLCIPRSLWLCYPGLYIPFSLRTGDTESNRLADRLLEAASRDGYHVPRYSMDGGDKLDTTSQANCKTYLCASGRVPCPYNRPIRGPWRCGGEILVKQSVLLQASKA